MKKILLLVAAVMVVSCTGVFAEQWTPVRISLVPGLALPPFAVTKGISAGILASQLDVVWGVEGSFIWSRVDKEMYGAQLVFVGARAGKMYGIQNSITSKAEEVRGIQGGFVSRANIVKGWQSSFAYSKAQDLTGLQTGIINYAKVLKGVQIGLINIAGNAKIKVLPIINAKF